MRPDDPTTPTTVPSPPSLSSSPTDSPSVPKRRQVKNACNHCQKASKKCDDNRPCLRCVTYGLQDDCRSSARKQRPKGIKRGPYKKRDSAQGIGTTVTGQGASPAFSSAPLVFHHDRLPDAFGSPNSETHLLGWAPSTTVHQAPYPQQYYTQFIQYHPPEFTQYQPPPPSTPGQDRIGQYPPDSPFFHTDNSSHPPQAHQGQ